MQKLIEFLRRYHFFLTFLALETLCVVMIIRSNPTPAAWYFNVSNIFRGWSQSLHSDVIDYLNLKKTNSDLAQENQLLLERLDALSALHDTSTLPVIRKTGYDFVPAKVVGNSMYLNKNTILLNKGTDDGIEKDMGVIAPEGLVGIVAEASENYAVVLSLLNKASLISAKIMPYNYTGTVYWDGADTHTVLMRDLPTHIYINKGDTIVTSGFSSIFPEGVMIGTVQKYEIEREKANYKVYITLSTMFASLQWVYIIKNLASLEQKELLRKFDELEQTIQ
jgi:rod shape-determining protein MreC